MDANDFINSLKLLTTNYLNALFFQIKKTWNWNKINILKSCKCYKINCCKPHSLIKTAKSVLRLTMQEQHWGFAQKAKTNLPPNCYVLHAKQTKTKQKTHFISTLSWEHLQIEVLKLHFFFFFYKNKIREEFFFCV